MMCGLVTYYNYDTTYTLAAIGELLWDRPKQTLLSYSWLVSWYSKESESWGNWMEWEGEFLEQALGDFKSHKNCVCIIHQCLMGTPEVSAVGNIHCIGELPVIYIGNSCPKYILCILCLSQVTLYNVLLVCLHVPHSSVSPSPECVFYIIKQICTSFNKVNVAA